jgi:putative transposase
MQFPIFESLSMANPRLPEAKIREILAEQTAGTSVGDIVKKHKISSATFYNWKSRYGEKSAEGPRRGRPKGSKNAPAAPKLPAMAASSGSDENRRLKVMIVDLMLQIEHLKEQLAKR